MSEETHHKMSKKIAQLTKVIFHLHSKNEENSNMHTCIQNAYEKEIETLLSQANSVIVKQKDAVQKAQEAAAFKEKMRELEKQHIEEREASQEDFKNYKVMLIKKEQELEEKHKAKVNEMKTEVMDIRKGFEERVKEFKKQIEDFRKNNEAIDALKKAHEKEIAKHVQEHNKKYNELLTEKLNSEDQLKAQAEKDLAQCNKDWQTKLNDIVKKARAEEQETAKQRIDNLRGDYEN
jgi:hypothetical protein